MGGRIPPHRQPLLQQPQTRIRGQSEQRRRNRPRQHQAVIHTGDAPKISSPNRHANRRRNRGHTNASHSSGPQPSQNHTSRQRHSPKQAAANDVIPIAFATSTSAGIDAPDPRIRIPKNRQQRIPGQRQNRQPRRILPQPRHRQHRPNSARLGTVCSTFANPITGLANPCRRVSRIPSGSPIPAASTIAESVNQRCSNVNRPISHPCKSKKLHHADTARCTA